MATKKERDRGNKQSRKTGIRSVLDRERDWDRRDNTRM